MDRASILIVEDEYITIEALSKFLVEMGYRISGYAKNCTDALDILEKNETDLAILDIQIQGEKDGIWLANKINQYYKIPFIFMTAFSDQNTLRKALNTSPYGYLVKPFNKNSVYTSIEVAMDNFNKQNSVHLSDKTAEKLKSKNLLFREHIFIKDGHSFVKIKIKDIIYIKSGRNYIEAFVQAGSYLIRSTLKEFTELLPDNLFYQIHRSYIINLKKIDKIFSDHIEAANKKIPISQAHKEELIQILNLK